jgi:hypothetical protein
LSSPAKDKARFLTEGVDFKNLDGDHKDDQNKVRLDKKKSSSWAKGGV